jgi:two-component system, OmpR family, phosphate regulon sensor histidine kinase PhoR
VLPELIVVIVVLIALTVALLLVARLANRRRSTLAHIRAHVGAAPSDDLEVAVQAALDSGREAEARAIGGQRDLTTLVGLVGAGILCVADDQTIVLANHAAHVFLGAAPASLVGRTVMEAFIDHGVETILEAARAGGTANGELAAVQGDRPSLVIRARRSPTAGTWLVFEDVSELRRLQRIRAEFVDNLSHELRTPITTVRLLAETLTREMDEEGASARARDMVGKIDVEAGHLAQMVGELLDLAKIEQDSAPLYLDDVDLGLIVRASVERLSLFAERQRVTLRPDLPPQPLWIRGDDVRLGQLLVNLLHNAIKFSPAGREVSVRARGAAGEVVVSVEDHGVGIPSADLDRVFERFYKVDKARVRGKGGTGLGLAIARHIVEGHGGRIWVESVEGRGATFWFAIPSRDLAEAA